MTRHLLMDPAFPDLVAEAAAQEAAASRSAPPAADAPAAGMPSLVAGLLRLLARLW